MDQYQVFLCIIGIFFFIVSHVSGQSCSNSSLCKCDMPLPPHLLICKGEYSMSEANKIAENTSPGYVFLELEVSNDTFSHLTYKHLKKFINLKTLILSGNEIESIEPDVFKNLTNLEKLDLSGNYFSKVSEEMLGTLKKLKFLSFANNKIDKIYPKAFAKISSLVSLDLSGNQLTAINSKWFAFQSNISILSLQNNHLKIVEIDAFRHLPFLEKLDLSKNELIEISYPVFVHHKNLKILSLAQNNLKTLHEGLFWSNSFLEKVNLTGNPWVCNKKLLPLNEFFRKHEADKEGAVCAEPEELRNLTLQDGLEVLNLEGNIAKDPTCNSMCNCTVSRDKLVITVDCRNRAFIKLPETLPLKTKALDLYGNNIRSLTTEHIDAEKWSDVAFLYLNNNLIDSLKGLEGTFLSRNLVALHLINNKLTEVPIHILAQFRLDELYLSQNPWNCDCNTVSFQTWLQDNYKSIRDLDDIRCSQASGTHPNQPIYRLKKSQLCPQDVNPVHILDVLNSLMAIAIIVIVCKLSYDYWLQKRTGKLPRFFSLNLK